MRHGILGLLWRGCDFGSGRQSGGDSTGGGACHDKAFQDLLLWRGCNSGSENRSSEDGVGGGACRVVEVRQTGAIL